MNLVIDIGNTNIVLGIFSETNLVKRWRLNTHKDSTLDEILLTLRGLLNESPTRYSPIEDAAIASVVPSLNYAWNAAVERLIGVRPRQMTPQTCNSIKLDYTKPSEIGADRLCNVLGLVSLNISAGIIIDFGTATTFDIFSENTYWGGAICLGIRTSLNELVRRASKLSEVELFWNQTIIGKTTDDALRNGILYGAVGQLEYILSKILIEKPMQDPVIIATGGLANLIGSHSKLIHKVEENLTLRGLNHFITIQST